ncbi:MAG: endonuclease/exonuclease/phosphatase family protein [Woeseiaceae bacterium]
MPKLPRVVLAIKVLICLLVVGHGLSLLGRYHFIFDNLTSFRVHFFVGFVITTIACGWVERSRWLLLSSMFVILSAVPLTPWVLTERAQNSPDSDFSILFVNLLVGNGNTRPLIAMVDDEQPTIVAVVELTPRHAQRLAPIHERYPHRYIDPRFAYGGIAIYSQIPLVATEVLHTSREAPVVATSLITVAGKRLRLVVAHPLSPTSFDGAARRNEQLDVLGDYLADQEYPVVLAGDLNITMWSPYYADFVARTQLVNAQWGRMIEGTWPAWFGPKVPIDHVLVSPDLSIAQFDVLDAVESDHLPIRAKIKIMGD